MTGKRNGPLDMPGGLGVSVKMPEQDNPDTLGQGDMGQGDIQAGNWNQNSQEARGLPLAELA